MDEAFFALQGEKTQTILCVLQGFSEAVPLAEVRRLASKFFDCRSLKNAGILYGFQVFETKTGGKFAGKMCAAAIGTASQRSRSEKGPFRRRQTVVNTGPWFKK